LSTPHVSQYIVAIWECTLLYRLLVLPVASLRVHTHLQVVMTTAMQQSVRN